MVFVHRCELACITPKPTDLLGFEEMQGVWGILFLFGVTLHCIDLH